MLKVRFSVPQNINLKAESWNNLWRLSSYARKYQSALLFPNWWVCSIVFFIKWSEKS